MIRSLVVIITVIPMVAVAEPERCSALKPRAFAKLTVRQQERLTSGEFWENLKPNWKTVEVEVQIDRAPHITTEILKSCPDVKVERSWPVDARRFTTRVLLRVTTFATLTRLAQLPAIKSISPRMNHRRKHELMDLPEIIDLD